LVIYFHDDVAICYIDFEEDKKVMTGELVYLVCSKGEKNKTN